MLRSAQINLKYANNSKLNILHKLTEEMSRVVNAFIDHLWEQQDFHSKFIQTKVKDTWLSARLQQALGKQALEIVKS